ncbi:MAG: hypothetical protein JWQ22_1051 [Devosia sp.]|nr:hypothetical protein [Devosia sp.]
MIPASYFFKQVYNQAWEEPTATTPVKKTRRLSGLMMPLSGAIRTLLSHRPRTHSHHAGVHAYD